MDNTLSERCEELLTPTNEYHISKEGKQLIRDMQARIVELEGLCEKK